MPLPIEIEFPLPNAQVGLSFPAGGDYELAKGFRIDAVVKIRCRLYPGGSTTPLVDSNDFTTSDTPSGRKPWSVSFNVPAGGTGSYANCRIEAYFVVDGVLGTAPEHAVDGINVSNQTGGLMVITGS